MDGTSATEQTRGTSATEQARDGRSEGDAVVVTRGLTKRYRGGQLAVDDLHLTVPAGSVFGFLGPNGSGKTTTISMRMVVVLPEPFGPRKPKTLPAGTARSRPSTASCPPR